MGLEPFLDRVRCPVCEQDAYDVLEPARYPEGVDEERLLEIYRSSTDEGRLDQLVRCRGCGLVYVNPRVRSDIIRRSYEGAVDPAFVSQNAPRVRSFARTLRGVCRSLGWTPSPDRRVLDVGCAGGAFPKAASDLGFSVVGVEPSRWLVDYGRRTYGLDLRAGTLAEQRFEDAGFDMATLWDVLEHLDRPVELLAECRRVLKPEGVLVLTYPDYASVARRLLRSRWPFFLAAHLYYFTPDTLVRLLRRTGFEPVLRRPYWQTLELGYVLKRAASVVGAFAPLGRLVEAAGAGALPVRYQMGQTLVVARRLP